MSENKYIKLSNGEKLYIKDNYGTISTKKGFETYFAKHFASVFSSDYEYLSSKDIENIFNKVYQYATKDGDNKFDKKEINAFIKDNFDVDFIKHVGVSSARLESFLLEVQALSDASLATKDKTKNIKYENSINKHFPELEFLGLGDDGNVDISRINDENFEKNFPAEEYKKSLAVSSKGEGIGFRKNGSEQFLDAAIYHNNDDIMLSFNVADQLRELNVEVVGSSLKIKSRDGRYLKVVDGQVVEFKKDGIKVLYKDGLVAEVTKGFDIYKQGFDEKTYYNEGVPYRTEDGRGNTVINYSMQNVAEMLASEQLNTKQLEKIINNSINKNTIGQDMDDYYMQTGRELFDDIQAAGLSLEVKDKLIEQINGPFTKSNGYKNGLKIEHSQIKNKYYTGDEYSVRYHGPIVYVENKTTNEVTRLNLRAVFDFDEMKNKYIKRSIKTIQNCSGEVLENLAIEIDYIRALKGGEAKRTDNSKFIAGGMYLSGQQNIVLGRYFHEMVLIHELAHGMDEIYVPEENWFKYLSDDGEFQNKYNALIEAWEAKGNKRFDGEDPYKGNNIWQVMRRGATYSTQDAGEGFAISMEIILGARQGEDARFVKKVLPELIDLSREQYLKIRAMKKEYRKK